MSNAVFEKLMNIAGWSVELGEQVRIVGQDPALPTRFRVGEMAAGIHAACGVAVSDLWELRTGRRQQVAVNLRAAAATFESYSYLRLEGTLPQRQIGITGFYPTSDGRWVLLHGSFPESPTRQRALKLLGCDDNAESAAASIINWEAQAFEDAIAEAGCCGAMVRSTEEWAAHPQGRALKQLPVVEVIKIGDSPPEPFGTGDRPLSSIRVLDLTRVLAGPTCARTLAEHGADVLRIGASQLPSSPLFAIDTGHGKRSAFLNLRQDGDAETLRAIIRKADVFSQSYRLGALAKLGFPPEALAEIRPGIVYVSMNCYGHEGPWRERRGWEQIAQTVTGVAKDEGSPGNPRLLPAAATDYSTGYMAAFGALVALGRRAREGGSYLVRASLSQSGMLLNSLGRVPEEDVAAVKQELQSEERRKFAEQMNAPFGRIPSLSPDEIEKLTIETDTPYGRMSYLAPVVQLSETPAQWALPAVPLGSNEPVWLGAE